MRILYAASNVKSFAKAADILDIVGRVKISGKQVNRLSEEVGLEMTAKRDGATEDYIHHRRKPPEESAPQIAVIGMDGGRINTRESGGGPGVHGQGWKEDKVACLLAMEGGTFDEDPHPQPPKCFLNAQKVDELVREIQANHGPRQENELPQLEALSASASSVTGSAAAVGEETTTAEDVAWPPQRAKNPRTVVATMKDCHEFGKMVAAEAYRRNFHGASRGAVLGDGSDWIWNQQKKWLAYLTPITDFVHALTYLYVTATVLSPTPADRWQLFVAWMTRVWQGGVQGVIEEMKQRLSELEPVKEGEKLPLTDAREVLRRTIGYLTNNADRMKYAEYRKAGLPVTSCMVESLIKEINYRTKGTEKFWDNPEGAEAILQLRAAVLSDDDRLRNFVTARPGSATVRDTTAKAGQAA